MWKLHQNSLGRKAPQNNEHINHGRDSNLPGKARVKDSVQRHMKITNHTEIDNAMNATINLDTIFTSDQISDGEIKRMLAY